MFKLLECGHIHVKMIHEDLFSFHWDLVTLNDTRKEIFCLYL